MVEPYEHQSSELASSPLGNPIELIVSNLV